MRTAPVRQPHSEQHIKDVAVVSAPVGAPWRDVPCQVGGGCCQADPQAWNHCLSACLFV